MQLLTFHIKCQIMGKVKEYYWDHIVNFNYDEMLDDSYLFEQYKKALNADENSLYLNTKQNESIRENQNTDLGSTT
jgi:hypothetical protein